MKCLSIELMSIEDSGVMSLSPTKSPKRSSDGGSNDDGGGDESERKQAPAPATSTATTTTLSEEPTATSESNDGETVASGTMMRAHGGKMSMAGRNSNSLRHLTKRFRSFSNDLLRSIESAHDMVDLGNSNFATATQLAAAQHFLAPLYLASNEPHDHLAPATGTSLGDADVNVNELGLDDLREEDERNVDKTSIAATIDAVTSAEQEPGHEPVDTVTDHDFEEMILNSVPSPRPMSLKQVRPALNLS